MPSKIVVALNDLPASERGLRTVIELSRASNAEFATVSMLGDLPGYTPFVIAVDPNASNSMKEERRAHDELHAKVSLLDQEHEVRAKSSIVDAQVRGCLISFKTNMPIRWLLVFIGTTSIYPGFGVPFITSPRMLPSECSVCIEHAEQEQRVISVEINLGFGGFTA
jgi:hypothetical protein